MSDPDQTAILTKLDADNRLRVNSTASHIEIFLHGQALTFSKEQLPITMGRDSGHCQVVVNRDVASRIHCSIEVRDEQIGLADCSQNGTFLRIGSNESFVLKGRFYPLIGTGKIRLGEPFPANEAETILFRMINRDGDG